MRPDFYPARSFLGPDKTTWTDFSRLQTLREMERAMCARVAAMESMPRSRRVQDELARENTGLVCFLSEIAELETNLAIL